MERYWALGLVVNVIRFYFVRGLDFRVQALGGLCLWFELVVW